MHLTDVDWLRRTLRGGHSPSGLGCTQHSLLWLLTALLRGAPFECARPDTHQHRRKDIMADEEKAFGGGYKQETLRLGYPAAAAFISRDPDHDTYVFRSFNSLTARNLLQLQGELITLERLMPQWMTRQLKIPAVGYSYHYAHGDLASLPSIRATQVRRCAKGRLSRRS